MHEMKCLEYLLEHLKLSKFRYVLLLFYDSFQKSSGNLTKYRLLTLKGKMITNDSAISRTSYV